MSTEVDSVDLGLLGDTRLALPHLACSYDCWLRSDRDLVSSLEPPREAGGLLAVHGVELPLVLLHLVDPERVVDDPFVFLLLLDFLRETKEEHMLLY